MKVENQSAEQLLDSQRQRQKGYVLKKPKEPDVKEKNKAQTQRKAARHDLKK
jgi:hypothetical protein